MTIGRMLAPALLLGALAACSCSQGGTGRREGGRTDVAVKSIDDVLAAHSDSLIALPGVVGTAIGLCDGERCIKIMLADSSPDARGRIPDRLEGYRVVVEVTGPIRPR